jgi:hypothetical protein
LGGAALAFGIFVRITRELIEGELGAMDSAILLAVAKKRPPWLTTAAAVSAKLNRLLHHGHVLKCGPRSWRTKLDALTP